MKGTYRKRNLWNWVSVSVLASIGWQPKPKLSWNPNFGRNETESETESSIGHIESQFYLFFVFALTANIRITGRLIQSRYDGNLVEWHSFLVIVLFISFYFDFFACYFLWRGQKSIRYFYIGKVYLICTHSTKIKGRNWSSGCNEYTLTSLKLFWLWSVTHKKIIISALNLKKYVTNISSK